MKTIDSTPPHEELRTTNTFFLILLLALVLRVVWAWWVPVVPVSDGEAYDTFAKNLVQHGTFGWSAEEPTAFWPPGTTFLHATLFWLLGIRYEPIVATNIALSLGIIWLTARLASRFWGQRVAITSALILAVWPTLVMYPTILASELPFLFLTLLAMDMWFHPRNEGHASWAWWAGLILGLASLVRPQALLLPAVFATAFVLTHKRPTSATKAQLKWIAASALVMGMVVAPWVWRNHQTYNEPLLTTNGGITLWMGNTPGTDGRYMPMPESLSHLPGNEKARVLANEAKAYILADPVAFLGRAATKLLILYNNESVGVSWNGKGIQAAFGESWELKLKRMTQATWALLFVLALVGLCASLYKIGWIKTLFSPLSLSVAYFTAIHMVVVSQERYHLAFAGQLAIFSALGLTTLLSWLLKRNQPPKTKLAP
ncbi:MAG: glycosyltransferase family 39 protein [Burkholderiaceae bacterium]